MISWNAQTHTLTCRYMPANGELPITGLCRYHSFLRINLSCFVFLHLPNDCKYFVNISSFKRWTMFYPDRKSLSLSNLEYTCSVLWSTFRRIKTYYSTHTCILDWKTLFMLAQKGNMHTYTTIFNSMCQQ